MTPNPWLMKIAGYYKQLGDDVALLREVEKPSRFDLIVIAKELSTNYLPPLRLLTHKNTKLIGNYFRRQKNFWHMPKSIYEARPDYSLYQFEFPSEFTKASFINTSYKGELIEVQKQDRYKLERAINFIIDKDFWEIEDLGAALDHVAQYDKIIFYEEVDLKKLLNMELIEKFVNLRLFQRPIKLKKVSSVQQLNETIKVLNTIKNLRPLPFESLTFITMIKDLNQKEALEQYFDCIRAAAIANKNLVQINFLVPKASAFKYASVFEPFLEYRNHKKSFFTYILERNYYISASEVLNNKQTWNNPVVSDIWKIYFKYPEVFEDGFTRWGGRPDKERKKLNQGDAEKFYDTYIL